MIKNKTKQTQHNSYLPCVYNLVREAGILQQELIVYQQIEMTCEGMVPVQSPCALWFKRPKLKISEFGVAEGVLIKKAPTEKMGGLMVPQTYV